MLRSIVLESVLVALLLGASCAVAQTEFSADVVNNKQAGSPIEVKLYFGKDKMRYELVAKARENQGGVGIVNLATQTATILLPQQHMYMEMPVQLASQRLVYNFFRTGDVENACSDWARLSNTQAGTCHKIGHETVNGRDTVKYEGVGSKGDVGYFWIDLQLRFPVKWSFDKNPNNGGELRNIKEGPQPASLFEVPAGYTKFDRGAMMQQRQ